MFRRLSLKQNLTGAFLSVALILCVVGGLGGRSLLRVISQYSQITEVTAPKMEQLLAMRTSLVSLMGTMVEMGLYGNPPEEINRLNTELGKIRADYAAAVKNYESLKLAPGEKELYDKVTDKWGEVLSYVVDVLQLAKSSDPKDKIAFGAAYRKPEFNKARQEFNEALDELLKFQASEGKKWEENAKSTAHTSIIAMWSTVVLGMLLAMCVGIFFANLLSRNLSVVADRLSEDADRLSGSAGEISSASQKLLSSIESQSAAIHETSSSVDEMNSMIGKNSENAAKSREVSIQSDETATRGRQSVEEMLKAIQEIDQGTTTMISQIEDSNRSFAEINRVINEIGGKTKIINDIVFQTKLLSFNASVEAARAGEHGKGFAVVAEEVGNLAQMSGNAAREITDMLQESLSKVDQIIQTTTSRIQGTVSQSQERIQQGKEVATNCGRILEDVVSNAQRVRAMLEEISAASREQAVGIGEIAKAMYSLNQSTKENSISSKQTSNASDELAEQADHLREVVSSLMKTVHGETKEKKTETPDAGSAPSEPSSEFDRLAA
jgi:methyl-accepting chemotaxis protein